MTSFYSVTPSLRFWPFVISILLTAPGAATSLGAQSGPPVQGTIALEGTMKKFYRAANVVVVTTMDGVEHVYHFAKDLVVHGGKGSGVDALEGLTERSTVVIHYTVDGQEQTAHEVDRIDSEGLAATEGTVFNIDIDRRRQQITVRYDNGKTETFQLTKHAAAESAGEEAAAGQGKIIIYYSNEAGQKVAHFFRKVAKS